MPFTLWPEKPFIPESRELHGPGVDFWRQPESNNDKRTEHPKLMRDGERRARIATRLVTNLSDAPIKPQHAGL